MRTQTRQPAVSVEYKQAFNPVIRRSPSQAQPQSVPEPSQAKAEPKKVPAQAPERKQTGEQFWSQFQGQALVFQLKSGAIVIGRFSGMQRNWLKIVDATITGKQNRATVPWVMVEINSLAHFHAPGQVEGIGCSKEWAILMSYCTFK